MLWVHRNYPKDFDSLSREEMLASGLKQFSQRFFTGETYDLQSSAYGGFMVEEMVRGSSPEEVIRDFPGEIPSPFRMEKLVGTYRYGSRTFALLAHKYKKGEIRASDPASIILVFSPDGSTWIAGYLMEKKDGVLERLSSLTERTSVSLSVQAALALVHLAPGKPVIDPCCGTGLIPLASKLLGNETFAGDNNYRMLKMSWKNRDDLGVKLEIVHRDAFEPWNEKGCLVTDFPADRNWTSNRKDLGLELFKAWVPHIASFCVILPEKVLHDLPRSVVIEKTIDFTAERKIIIGFIN